MATILEDFEDATFVVPIAGTWTRVQGTAAAGSWSLRSAAIGHNSETDAEVTVPAQATSLTFSYQVSSEEDFDEFFVLVDAVQVLDASGNVPWTSTTINVTGASTVTFRYKKDESVNGGQDAAWIDQLSFTVPDTGTPKAATDGGTLAETASIDQVPEVAKASSDGATLVEARWVSEPQSATVPPSIRSASTAASGGASYTVNAPAGVALNDTVIAIQATDRGTTLQMTTPTGGTEWLPLDALDDESELGIPQVVRLWWKRAGGAEPGLYTFKQANAGDGICVVVAIKDASLTVDPVMARSTDGIGVNATTPGITPTSASDLELRLVAAYALGTGMSLAPPAGTDPVASIQSRIYTLAAAAARLLESADATAPANFVASVNELDWRVGYTLAIAPAVTGPPQDAKAGSDAATLAESASVLIVPDAEPVAADDTATLTETAAAAADVVTSDSAALVEVLDVQAGPAAADQATLAEESALQQRRDGDDQALLVDTSQLDVQATATDAGVLSELVDLTETIGPVASDAGTLTEAAAVMAEASAADAGTLTESAEAVIAKEADDSGQLTETVLISVAGVDAAALSEQAAVDAAVAAADGALLDDGALLEAPKASADAAALSEQAVVVETREIGGVGLVRRGWSVYSPRRRWAAGRPRRGWRADSPRT